MSAYREKSHAQRQSVPITHLGTRLFPTRRHSSNAEVATGRPKIIVKSGSSTRYRHKSSLSDVAISRSVSVRLSVVVSTQAC
ncbi:uncharacterized protein RCO7_14275 [Rhynchosporium graminicola]|uniref:Uncharacterized protein n=1 Tax=Rhynchosporium graminicola TaxID=2792576 RepID=A0A1E1K695_9HELO|nr:uncharacterized protein RCO7_14275 [Rhynchosporium commune]